MAGIKKVAVAGGTGRYGKPTVKALVEAGFQTTILTHRPEAEVKNAPPGVEVKQVDYDSFDSLKSAMTGQDAVVATLLMSVIPKQKLIIDAAIAAGVKHYIPSEFTSESRHPIARESPLNATIVEIQDYLTAQGDKIGWNVVNSAGIDFIFDVPFVVDFDNQSAILWDGGKNGWSIGSTEIAGKAIAACLKQPSKIKNHQVRPEGTVITQEQVLGIAEKISGKKWKVETKDAQATFNELGAKLAGGNLSHGELMFTLMNMHAAETFGNGFFPGVYDPSDNEWLGLTDIKISDKEVEDAIRYRVEKGLKGHAEGETFKDVAQGIADTHSAK